MTSSTPLLDRIAARQPRKVLPFPQPDNRPVWIRRKDAQGLPVKDTTAYVSGSFVPSGSERGA